MTPAEPSSRLYRLAAWPPMGIAATCLTGTVALYMALVAFNNITDYDTNLLFVQHVLSMDTTFQDDDLMWRAVTISQVHTLAYLAIIGWEVIAAAVLIWATVRWAGAASGRDPGRVRRAQRLAVYGLLMVLLLFGAGFIAIGGEWFAMWQSAEWNGLPAAIRNVTLAGLVLVITHLAAEQLQRHPAPAPDNVTGPTPAAAAQEAAAVPEERPAERPAEGPAEGRADGPAEGPREGPAAGPREGA